MLCKKIPKFRLRTLWGWGAQHLPYEITGGARFGWGSMGPCLGISLPISPQKYARKTSRISGRKNNCKNGRIYGDSYGQCNNRIIFNSHLIFTPPTCIFILFHLS